MTTKLFVGNLPWKATEAELKSHFEACGAVESVKIVLDSITGRSRGFGFVVMQTQEGAQAAITSLDGQTFGDREIRVSPAEDKAPRPRSEGGREGPPRRPNSGFDRRRNDR